MNIQTWLRIKQNHLIKSHFSDDPALSCQVLLARCLKQSRTWVMSHPEHVLSDQHIADLETTFSQLDSGVPLPYVIHHQSFFGLDFFVDKNVLIPRPETELLVEEAIRWGKQYDKPVRALDVGTGSACIPISIAHHVTDIHFYAVDISFKALQVARKNINHFHLSAQIECIQGNLLDPIKSDFDLICANLPYIPSHKLAHLAVARNEPLLALDGGADGLDLIRRLMNQISTVSSTDSLCLLEFEAEQGDAIDNLAQNYFPRAKIQRIKDLAGHDRILRIEPNYEN